MTHATGSTRSTPASAATALKLWVVLSRAHAAVAAHAHADIVRHDLTPTEFGVLEALHHKGPIILGELQRRVLVSSGGMTYVVDRLVRKGLLERRACPEDRRATYAALTDAGEELMKRVFPEHAAAIERALSGLSDEEKETAADLLRRLGLAAAALEDEAAK